MKPVLAIVPDPAPEALPVQGRKELLGALMLLSGFCGISYEVLYGRLIGDLVGSQFLVSACVLLTFLLGIGAGTLLAHRLWRFLWLLEAGVGGWALAAAFGRPALDALFYAAGASPGHIATLCVAVLLPPAFLIGCSVPLFAGYLRVLEPGPVFARVYTLYNFGAALTALGIEFWILRALGLRGAVLAIALLNGVVAVALRTAYGDLRNQRPPAAAPASFRVDELSALALASVGSAIFQLLMIKVAECLLGPYRETFALVLAVVLFGIAAGSALTRRLRLGLAPVLLASLAGLGWLLAGLRPVATLYASLAETAARSHFTAVALKLAVLVLLMGLPALGFGATVPALLRDRHEQGQVARAAGRLLFVSSVANAGGFLLMALVLHRHLDYGAIVLVVAACTAVALVVHRPPRLRRALAAGALALAAAGLWRACWTEDLLYLGHTAFQSRDELDSSLRRWQHVEKFRGYEDVFSLTWMGGQPYFFINGFISIALDSPSEKVVGGFSSLFAPRLDRALVLGVGSGATAGTVARLFERMDGVEINPLVLENLPRMARWNFGLAERANVRLVHDDAIHFTKASRQRYSLILNTVTTPLYFSSSKLYTLDFLRAVRARLTPDGVYVTWFDSRVGDRGADIILATLSRVFDDCWLGAVRATYYLLVCSPQRVELRHPHLVAQDPVLARYFLEEELDPEAVAQGLLTTQAFALAGDRDVPANTLDYPALEFEIARLRRRGIEAFRRRVEDSVELRSLRPALERSGGWDPVAGALYLPRLLGDTTLTRRYGEQARALAPDFDARREALRARYLRARAAWAAEGGRGPERGREAR
jgi:predicted membrane-bound spermidine synthase